jgi:murein DD-endopeptidase MepM/ murein hydrolase activator NlpD
VSSPSGRRLKCVRAAKAAGFGLAALLLALSLTVAFNPEVVQAGSSTGLNQQLKSLRTQLNEVRANLKKAAAARKAALGDVAALDQSVDYAQAALDSAEAAHTTAAARLADLQGQLGELVADLDRNQQELTKTQSDLTKQQEVLCNRVVSMYKSGGNLGYLATMLNDDSLSLAEVLERFDLLSTIAEQDVELLAQIKVLKAQVEDQRRALQEERTRVAALEADQDTVTQELKAAENECQASVDELAAARAAKKAILVAIENDQSSWARQEDQLLADSDRISALLQKASSGTSTKAGKGALSYPVNGPITSGFGYRVHPIFHVRKLHTGVDFDVDAGVPVKAAAAGTVVFAGWRGGYGKCVVIDHGGGLATLYAHQSTILVSVGQVVKRGEVIGKVGSTGYSTGPHLHFEVRVNGSPMDPKGYL